MAYSASRKVMQIVLCTMTQISLLLNKVIELSSLIPLYLYLITISIFLNRLETDLGVRVETE